MAKKLGDEQPRTQPDWPDNIYIIGIICIYVVRNAYDNNYFPSARCDRYRPRAGCIN